MITLMYALLIIIILFEVFSIFKSIFKSWKECESINQKIISIVIGAIISIIAGYLTFKIGVGIIFLF